jgi:predicted nucleic acid-binding protein
MCFVLDANSFHCLFNKTSKGHAEFVPLLDWLYNNPRTSLVIGGKTYRKEMGRLCKYLNYIVELKRARKLSEIKDDVVDAEEERLKLAVTHQKFNDAHIIAIICASGCMLFASHDKRADRFLRMPDLYPKGQKRPHIYRTAQHKALLKSEHIVKLRNVGH